MAELSTLIEVIKLYCKDKNGNVRSYHIFIEDFTDVEKAVVYTVKKIEPDGKETIDKKEFTIGKNIGKKNETTYFQQALNEANSMANKLMDKGYSEEIPEGSFNTDANGNMKPMLATPYKEGLVRYPCICQPKLDGVRCLCWEDEEGNIRTTSRLGKDYDIPQIREFLEWNRHVLPLDGELYDHSELTFQEIVSAVKRRSELTDKIKLTVYDKPIGNTTCEERVMQILPKCFENISSDAPIRLLESRICNNFEEVDNYHDECVKRGYEGVIIRNMDGLYEFGFRSRDLIKLKKFQDSEFRIIDVIEAEGRDKGTGIFVVVTDDGKPFKAKPKGSKEERTDYLINKDSLIGKMCTVKYQGLSDGGIPRFPTALSIRDYE